MGKFPNARKIKLNKLVGLKTIHNQEPIRYCVRVTLLSEHKFYEVANLGNFDMIVGMKGMRKIDAMIDTKTFRLICIYQKIP